MTLKPKASVEATGPDAIRTGGKDLGWDYAELKPGNPQGRADGWKQLNSRKGKYQGRGALYQYYGKPGSFNFTGPHFPDPSVQLPLF